MAMRLEIVLGHLAKMDLEELRTVKKAVTEEISAKNKEAGRTSEQSKLWNILTRSRRAYYPLDDFYEERLKELVHYTEKEFLKWNTVGPATLSVAKEELAKRGLSFKTT